MPHFLKTWSYTLFMLAVYIAVFRLWQEYPSRAMFLTGAGLGAAVLVAGMVWAARRDYFANRTDLVLHAMVIVDVALEGGAYEALRAFSLYVFGSEGIVGTFHANHNFYVCAAAFAVLVGGYHGWAVLRRSRQLVHV